MPAGIFENDHVVATEPTWHRMETLVKKIDFENSGLNWPVEASPVCDKNGRPINGFQLISTPTESDPLFPLAVMKGRYTPIQNFTIFECVVKSLSGVKYIITCSGSLGNRTKVFISVRLAEPGSDKFYVNGEEFLANLNFLSSHNGDSSFFIFDSNTRVVCQNTFNMAMSARCSSNLKRHAKHTKGSPFKIETITNEIHEALSGRDLFKSELERIAKFKCSYDEAIAFAAGMLFPAHRSVPSKSVQDSARGIADAFRGGEGNSGKTQYDLFNGVTQFFTRNTSRSDSDIYTSSFIGVGANRKGEAFDLLTSKDGFKNTVRKGDAALALVN